MKVCALRTVVGCALTLPGAASALAQWTGPRPNENPDVIVSSVGGTYDGATGVSFYGVSGGIASYSIGSDSCNIGNAPAIWVTSRSGYASSDNFGAPYNQHPVIGGAVYRLFNGRFEQIGMSWLKHGFCAADFCGSGFNSGGLSGCLNVGGVPPDRTGCVEDLGNTHPSCSFLGYGRATDTYGSGLNGAQGDLGPRSEVNAWTGSFPYPPNRAGSNPVSCLNKRLLVSGADFDSATYPRYNASTNPSGSQFFAEVVYIVTDEWPTERYNNYSYRKLIVPATTSNSTTTGCTGAYYPISFATGTGNLTVPMHPAIDAWHAADPSVVVAIADVPNDGRFYVGAKVTDLGDGTWSYEYAVFNMNSDRSAASFTIPKANSSAVQISNVGFHAPAYHSGEPYSAAPWAGAVNSSDITWSTDSYAANPNANALRWSTLYNFRFTASRPPKTGSVELGLFKPRVQTGDADSIAIGSVLVPGDPPPCRADFNGANGATVQDIFDFIAAWFGADPRADFNGVDGTTIQDIFDFLAAWFAGCP